MRHPGETRLALFAGGDLHGLERWTTALHVRRCAECAREVDGFRSAAAVFEEACTSVPRDLGWERLAAEMTANIHVGYEAGECVGGPPRVHAPVRWRLAAALAGLVILLSGAWWLNMPGGKRRTAPDEVVLEATPSGIQMRQSDGALTLMHTRAASQTVFVSAPGTLRARFVDSETGQVTINNVYAE
ncbi:MAG: hypothetical protein HYZ57_04765 [Acidobacteria bacterium]|nr:hypothetical protein [Acidobacteriota bacterium]MBI3279136.1 hypothetical protein [Acidobacteriota bacterium]